MELSVAVEAIELDLLKLKEVVCRDLEIRLRNQTGKGEELSVGNLNAYDWKMDSPFMKIILRSSVLGYIFPFQKTAYLFHNTANNLIEPLSRAFSDSGYKPCVKDMWQEAYHILQHEERFNPRERV